MGEIKSTLDLVMEKTRNLSLSSEEKKEQKDKEVGSRIRGLLLKFLDQALSLDNFKSEYKKLQKDYDLAGNSPLIKEILGQMELAKDNQALYDLLAELKVFDLEGLTAVIQQFKTECDAAAEERRKALKNHIAKTHFISGSAVVPNLEDDEHWQKEAAEIQAKYDRMLDKEKTRILKEQ